MTRRRSVKLPWKIREQQAPSDALLIREYRRWAHLVGSIFQRSIRSAVEDVRTARRADDDEERDEYDYITDADAAEAAYRAREAVKRAAAAVAALPSPTPRQIRALVTAQARQAARAERTHLVRLGANRAALALRLSVPPDRLLGIDIAPTAAEALAIEERVRAHLDLITRIPQEQIAGYERWIADDIVAGKRWETVARDLTDRLGIDDRHAELIARDQTAKLNAAVTKGTQAAAGIDRYVWRATDDDRTRATHAAADGIVWLWSSPPPDTGPYGQAAHPGEGIQCRCVADPVIPADLLDPDADPVPLPAPGTRVA